MLEGSGLMEPKEKRTPENHHELLKNLVKNTPYNRDEDEFEHLISFVIHFVRDKKDKVNHACYIDHSLGMERRIDTRIVTEFLPKKVLQYLVEIRDEANTTS